MEENKSEKLKKYQAIFVKLKEQDFPGSEQLESDYKSIPDRKKANKEAEEKAEEFFKKYGVGNRLEINRPLERMEAYELLLDILITIDAKQFKNIHKGTPYYFFGWTTFQLRDFSKAMFYMDAAVNEDLKNDDIKNKKSTTPALDFFLLPRKFEQVPSGVSDHLKLFEIIKQTLKKYNADGKSKITIEDFRSKFIEIIVYSNDPKERSLLTALYTFLLEYAEKEKQIKIRSDTGGSIQPFINHLFDGARLLESLLTIKGATGKGLSQKIESLSSTGNLAVPNLSVTPFSKLFHQNSWPNSLADAEPQYSCLDASGVKFKDKNFACAYIIRNATGHSLLSDDIFDEKTYNILYNSLVNSIFWTIDRLWLH